MFGLKLDEGPVDKWERTGRLELELGRVGLVTGLVDPKSKR